VNPPSPAESKEPSPGATPEDVVVVTTAGRERRAVSAIRNHDFRQSGFLAPSELRRIRLRQEQFARSLAARMAIFLRLEFTLQLAKIQILGYQQFTENLSSPTHITLFRTDPLKGVGLLVIPPRLGLGLVDRLLGGAGQMPDSARDLTEIETALTDQIATLLLTEWCNHWPEMRDLQPALLGHENNSRFLQTAPPDTAMLVLTLEAGIGSALEPVQMALPFATIEPLLSQLSPAIAEPVPAPARAARLAWNAQFDDLTVKASARWEGLKISAGEITRLKPGNVLMLDAACAGQVHLSFSQTPKFIGRPGVCGNKWAVQLTQVLPD
jgi:flagellar motor switch protein FliM